MFSTLAPEVENVTDGVEPVDSTEAEDITTTVALEVAVATLEDETIHGLEVEDVCTVALEVSTAALEEEATIR